MTSYQIVYPTAHAIENNFETMDCGYLIPLSEGKFANQLKLANKLKRQIW